MDGIPHGKLITIKEVAALLGCHEKTVRRLVEAGRLSRPKMHGKSPRWFEADCHVYLYKLGRGDFDEAPTVEDDDTPENPPRRNADRKGQDGTQLGQEGTPS